MRFALLLLILLLAMGCPRQSNETVPVAQARPANGSAPILPSSKKQLSSDAKMAEAPVEIKGTRLSGPEIKPPIDYLELGTGFKAAPIPSAVVADLAGAKVSSDKSEVGLVIDGETVWLQGFTTKANEQQILNYYSGILSAKGFESFDDSGILKKGKRGKTKKKTMRSWRTDDERSQVYVYDSGEVTAPTEEAKPRPIYVVEVHDRPTTANGGTGP